MTARSVTRRSTGRIEVSGRSHVPTTLDRPLALCALRDQGFAPVTRSMAPPIPGTIRLGIIQFAR